MQRRTPLSSPSTVTRNHPPFSPPAGDRVINGHGDEPIRAEDESEGGECGDVRGTAQTKIVNRPVQGQRGQVQAQGGGKRAKGDQNGDIAMDVMPQFMSEYRFDLVR